MSRFHTESRLAIKRAFKQVKEGDKEMTQELMSITIGDVLRMIKEMKKTMPEYAETLMGPRTRGSTTLKGLDYLDPHRVCKLLEIKENGTHIYTAHAPELDGMCGAGSLKEVIEKGLVDQVRVRVGVHGPELYISNASNQHHPNDDITIITVLDDHGNRVVATWHPGPPFEPLDTNTGVKYDTK